MRHETEAESILKWIDNHIEPREKTILDGGVTNIEDYRHLSGAIWGLRLVRNEIARRKSLYEDD